MSSRGPWQCPRVDVGKVHLRGPLKFVSQMSIFRVLHAWTISKSTRGHLFPAGLSILTFIVSNRCFIPVFSLFLHIFASFIFFLFFCRK
jgi:hypothetical protein